MDKAGMSDGAVLIRINVTDSYAASTTLKVSQDTLAEEVCAAISFKLGIPEGDKIFDSLICVVTGFDGKTHFHWMKTLKRTGNVLEVQADMLKKRAMLTRNPDILNSFTVSWYYKDIRSAPLRLDGDVSGNSSSEDEAEISLNDLIYFGSGDRRAVLFKRSNRDPNLWRKRLCILNDKLWCINLKKKAPFATCIELNGKIMSQDEAPELNYPNGLIIQRPNQTTYFLRAGSGSEQSLWKEELQDRAEYGAENAVLFMGEMIICDEEDARGTKKNRVTSASLQRETLWKALQESTRLLPEREIDTETEGSVLEERLSNVGSLKPRASESDSNGSRHRVRSIEESEEPSTPTVISYGLDDGTENSPVGDIAEEDGLLNADQAFIARDPQARMDAYIKYRSRYPSSSQSASSRSRPVSRRIGAIRGTSPGLGLSHLSLATAVSVEEVPPLLSALPCAPIRVIHSFHQHSPHAAAALTLIDAIHDFRGAFRHDLHLKPRELWSLALKIYHRHFRRFVLSARNSTCSPWAATVQMLSLHPSSPSPPSSPLPPSAPLLLSLREQATVILLERLQQALLSNLQREVVSPKKVVQRKPTEQASYWFWPSSEADETLSFRREEKRSEASEARHRLSLSVGYGWQIVDPAVRPHSSLFDELLSDDALFVEGENGRATDR
jgi:hypothetical protein